MNSAYGRFSLNSHKEVSELTQNEDLILQMI